MAAISADLRWLFAHIRFCTMLPPAAGHTTGGIGTALRQYLEHEWMRKVNEQRQQQGNQQEQAATDPKQQQVPLLKFDTKVAGNHQGCFCPCSMQWHRLASSIVWWCLCVHGGLTGSALVLEIP